MFVMYYPQLIAAGMVYKAIPPLYSIKLGKKKIKDGKGKTITVDNQKYFTEQIDITRYIQKMFVKQYVMGKAKKDSMASKDMTIFFMKNIDYIYYLEETANTYAVNPYLLEMVLIHYITNKGVNISKLQKEIKSAFRFMDAKLEKKIPVISGTIEKSNLIIFHDKFISDCANIIDIMNDNDQLYYYVNGEKMSIYRIMQLYNSISPNGVQRYKGLGEMDDWELAESTLYPGSDRTLVRYTLEDAKEEISAIREYESNSKKILSLVGQVSREDLIE